MGTVVSLQACCQFFAYGRVPAFIEFNCKYSLRQQPESLYRTVQEVVPARFWKIKIESHVRISTLCPILYFLFLS